MTKKMNPDKLKLKEGRQLNEDELLKYEIAEELGLLDKVRDTGWKSLTAKESGKIGGIMTKRKRERIENPSSNS